MMKKRAFWGRRNCNNSHLAWCFFFSSFFCRVFSPPCHRRYPSVTYGVPYFLSPVSMEVHTIIKARSFYQPKSSVIFILRLYSHTIFLIHKALVKSLDTQISLYGSWRGIHTTTKHYSILFFFHLPNSHPCHGSPFISSLEELTTQQVHHSQDHASRGITQPSYSHEIFRA